MKTFSGLKLRREIVLRADPRTQSERIRQWLLESLTPGTDVYLAYRMHNAEEGGFQFEKDMVKLAEDLRYGAGFRSQEAVYWLLRIWEEMIHRHALKTAWRVAKVLKTWKTESRGRRIARGTAYVYPRIGVALAIGYCTLLGAGSTRRYLSELAIRSSVAGWYFVLLTTAAMIGLIFAVVEVQRRTRYFTVSVLCRTVIMYAFGAAYALGAASVHYELKAWLNRGPSCADSLLLGAMALAIGFAAQLFWRERPVSEPL